MTKTGSSGCAAAEDRESQQECFSGGKIKEDAPKFKIMDGCIGCGMCYGICSFSAVYRDGERFRIDEERCSGCGICALNCPIEAIVLRGGK